MSDGRSISEKLGKSLQITVAEGELLIKEGEESKSMFLLTRGTLEVYKTRSDKKIVLSIIKPGEVVGEMSFLSNVARSANVVATEYCELVQIDGTKWKTQLDKAPQWMIALINCLSERLRLANNRIKDLGPAENFDL
jgi:CRP/FNR family transcriptional regulator, cyclic AMP receptor protein